VTTPTGTPESRTRGQRQPCGARHRVEPWFGITAPRHAGSLPRGAHRSSRFQFSPTVGQARASGALRTIFGIAHAGIGHPRHCGPHPPGDGWPARPLPIAGQNRQTRRQAQEPGPWSNRRVPQGAKGREGNGGSQDLGGSRKRTVYSGSMRAWMSHAGEGSQATCHVGT
jgi:hypothetical protein